MTKGFCLICTKDFQDIAQAFIKGLRKFHSEPIEIITADDLDIDLPGVKILKVKDHPIFANSKTSTAYYLRMHIPELISFDTILYSDIDVLVNCSLRELFDRAEQGFICVNPVPYKQVFWYPQAWAAYGRAYNDGLWCMDKENTLLIKSKYKEFALENIANASSQVTWNKCFYELRKQSIKLNIYELAEKYVFKLWEIDTGLDPIYMIDHSILQPVCYHLGTGQGRDNALSFNHPAVEIFKSLMKNNA